MEKLGKKIGEGMLGVLGILNLVFVFLDWVCSEGVGGDGRY